MKNSYNLIELYASNPELFEGSTAALITALREKRVKQNETTVYNRRKINLAGNAELFDKSVSKLEGVTDFEKGQLQGNQAFLATGMQLRYAFNAAGTTTVHDQTYTNCIFAFDALAPMNPAIDLDTTASGLQNAAVPVRRVPTELLNANFELAINGGIKYRCPVRDLFVEGNRVERLTSHDDLIVSFGLSPILLLPNKDIQATIRFNPNTITPAGNHFVELSLNGIIVFE